MFWDIDWGNGLTLLTYFWTGAMFQLLDLKRICNLKIAILISLLYVCFNPYLYFLAPYFVGYLVISFAIADKPVFSKYIKRDICYGLYLYAFPIQQLLIWLIIVKNRINIPVYGMFLLSTIITWIIAEVNFFVFERVPKRL